MNVFVLVCCSDLLSKDAVGVLSKGKFSEPLIRTLAVITGSACNKS